MKVLFLTKYYPPSEGGIERYGQMLCSDLVARGIGVEVVAAAEGRERTREEWVDGVKVHRLHPAMNFSSTPMTFDLPLLLKNIADGFDLLHINFPNPWTDLLYLALGRDRKAVMTYHSDIFRQSGTLSGFLLRAYHPFIHRVLAKVSAVVASSPNCIVNSPFLSRQTDKCRVIPMPVDVAALDGADPVQVGKERERFGKFVLFVGRLVEYKGLKYLIEALNQLDDTKLVVVGSGPLEQEHSKLVGQLGLQDRVCFLGRVSDERRRLLYHACRCFVLPSVSHAEGFGIVLAEAMACGKPVISTQLQTGTSYVNLDGVTGYVVPPRAPELLADKINVLMRDDVIHQQLGDRAKRRAVKEFDRSIVTEKTVNLYEEVMSRNRFAD